MRITLDVPESEMARVVPLIAWNMRELSVTIKALKPKYEKSGNVSGWEE